MRYKRFVINNYRAIAGSLAIELGKRSLTPIVGVNESGKTTILQAIFAFDYCNDRLHGGRHLIDTSNLYRNASPPAVIEATIEMSRADLKAAISSCGEAHMEMKTHLAKIAAKRIVPETVTIRRNLKTKKYSWASGGFGPPDVQHALAEQVVRCLPYILFFDDFRDKVEDKIEISTSSKGANAEWLSIIEQLFEQTDGSFSVHDLPDLEDRHRKSVLAKVQRQLNKTLTSEWQTFKLDDRDALKVSLEFLQEVQETPADPATQRAALGAGPQGASLVTAGARAPAKSAATPTSSTAPAQRVVRNFIKLEVVETDSHGDEHFFFISDRSKGFYWFFNFVMKLEFNPKVVEESAQTIYLLDEPGSYCMPSPNESSA